MRFRSVVNRGEFLLHASPGCILTAWEGPFLLNSEDIYFRFGGWCTTPKGGQKAISALWEDIKTRKRVRGSLPLASQSPVTWESSTCTQTWFYFIFSGSRPGILVCFRSFKSKEGLSGPLQAFPSWGRLSLHPVTLMVFLNHSWVLLGVDPLIASSNWPVGVKLPGGNILGGRGKADPTQARVGGLPPWRQWSGAWQPQPGLALCMVSLGGQVAKPCLGLLTGSFHSFVILFSKYNHSSYSVRDHIFCKAILPPAETRPPHGEHSIGMYLAVVAP